MQAMSRQDRDPDSDPTGEELLDRSRPPFRFWIPSAPALVIGHSQDPERELNGEAVLRDGIPVHRRMGGGGAVLLSPACVCVGLRFARRKGQTLHDYFEAGSDLIKRTLSQAYGLELATRGISDLAFTGGDGRTRKVVGCSLYMPRDFALYLASILVRADLEEIGTYLAHPSREPDYRAGRQHWDFLVGLDEACGRAIAPAEIVSRLQAALEPGLRMDLDWHREPSTTAPPG
jgi:lipoate-protein ligase A